MKLLLDSHAFIWAISDPNRLSRTGRTLLENADNSLFISVVTGWELAIKQQQGRLRLPTDFQTIADQLQAVILAVEPGDIETYLGLPMHHRDPFDRMLIAQSIRYQAVLLSQDKELQQYPTDIIW